MMDDTKNEILELDPRQKILYILAKKGGQAAPTEIIKEAGITTNTFYLNIRDLINDGLVVKKHKLYQITEAGRQELKNLAIAILEVVA